MTVIVAALLLVDFAIPIKLTSTPSHALSFVRLSRVNPRGVFVIFIVSCPRVLDGLLRAAIKCLKITFQEGGPGKLAP